MKIAICDDQLNQLEELTSFINEYGAAKCMDISVAGFSHPDQLLRVCEQDTFHIYLLDIVMPMIDGISLGKEIRHRDHEAHIIFATTEPRFALDAFAANPINYLVKPVSKDALFQTLDLAASKIAASSQFTVPIKTAEGMRVVRLKEIVYCEYQNHTILYTLFSGEMIKSRTVIGRFMDNVEPLLSSRCFIHPHASFFVNMNYIEKFSKDSFVLRGGARIPIAAIQYNAVRDTYMDYLMSRERN